ncbi:Pvc16 family protein [Halovivax limisalsi]|uniref:Pvc16 family protein n=1 Tax=Halovivax limisalsi TaxID=1453760 RepID=UPI001FFC5242|nr:Pvc16 family protein [Halovivax limisalsi]
MSFTAITDVSSLLVEVLRERASPEWHPIDPAGIVVASPADVDDLSNAQLVLYPFRIERDDRAGSVNPTVDDTTRVDPPLSVSVRYLVVPQRVGDDEDATDGGDGLELADRLDTLGAALQLFHDLGQLDPTAGTTALWQDAPLSVRIVDEPLEDLVSLWSQLGDVSYQSAATVDVSPVLIPSLNEETFTRVEERETGVGRHAPDEDA